jgi:hypothetical protein
MIDVLVQGCMLLAGFALIGAAAFVCCWLITRFLPSPYKEIMEDLEESCRLCELLLRALQEANSRASEDSRWGQEQRLRGVSTNDRGKQGKEKERSPRSPFH